MPFLDEDGVTRLTEDYLDIFAPKEELGEGDGTNAGPIYELTAKGHAEQFSTSGKNLWPFGDRTFTRAKVLTFDSPLSVGTYTMSAVVTSTDTDTNTCAVLFYFDDDSSTLLTLTRGQRASAQIVASKPIVRVNIYASDSSAHSEGDTVTFSDIQLELGSEATEYEPYTGGAPSPSPDYPQEIQVVRGRNLLDESAMIDGGYIGTSSGAVNQNNAFKYLDYIEIEQGEYTLSLTQASLAGTVTVACYGSDKSFVSLLKSFSASANTHYSISFTMPSNAKYIRLSFAIGSKHAQLTKGSTPQPYVPYGHVGMEAQGKNLLDTSTYYYLTNGTVSYGDHAITLSKVNSGSSATVEFHVEGLIIGSSYTFSVASTISADGIVYAINEARNRTHVYFTNGSKATFTATETTCWIRLQVAVASTASSVAFNGLQLELGSEATEYEPYYHSITPIPLPDRGWVGGLPDGISDILTLDGAGKCEWELADAETTTAATDGITGTVGTDLLSTTGQIADGATVLYKLATPIHESKGYIKDWPTDIPEGATITIPELDALNVKYFVANDSISQYAKQWYERTKDADIADVEDAVGDLASVTANLVNHDLFYFGYDEVNGKKMISIFKRGDI